MNQISAMSMLNDHHREVGDGRLMFRCVTRSWQCYLQVSPIFDTCRAIMNLLSDSVSCASAGTDTTSHTLAFLMLCLADNPQVQERSVTACAVGCSILQSFIFIH